MKKTTKRSTAILTRIPPADLSAINKRFKKTRADAGMSQPEFAEKLKTTLSIVKQIEAGNNLPSYYVLKNWKKKFAVSYDWIIDGSNK